MDENRTQWQPVEPTERVEPVMQAPYPNPYLMGA